MFERDIRWWVEECIARGWSPIRIAPGEKGCFDKDWQNKDFPPEVFGDQDGLAINVGKTPGLVDVDLDWDEARSVAQHPLLFGDIPGFGREEADAGHRYVMCADAPDKKEMFRIPSLCQGGCRGKG